MYVIVGFNSNEGTSQQIPVHQRIKIYTRTENEIFGGRWGKLNNSRLYVFISINISSASYECPIGALRSVLLTVIGDIP
jgi:hypothetical protein